MTWRQDRSRSGNNILTMGIMHETVQRWVEDEPEWLIADGAVFQATRSYPDMTELVKVEVPDSLSILGRFAQSGARLVYHFSGVESGKPRMEFRLNGSKGRYGLMRFKSSCSLVRRDHLRKQRSQLPVGKVAVGRSKRTS